MKFCVIGVGRFGYHVATILAKNDVDVLVVDSNEAIIASIRDKVTHAICMRISDEEGLRAIGVDEIDTVVIAMGENFAKSILVTSLIKQSLKVPRVIARSISQIHKEILELVGADEVILPERDAGIVLADRLSLPFKTVFRLAENFSISEIIAPAFFIGSTVDEIDFRDTYEVTLLGKKVNKKIVPLKGTMLIEEGDLLIVSGSNENLLYLKNL